MDGWTRHARNALFFTSACSAIACGMLTAFPPLNPPSLPTGMGELPLRDALALAAAILGTTGLAVHFSSRTTSAQSNQSLLTTNAVENHLQIHNLVPTPGADAAQNGADFRSISMEILQEVREGLVKERRRAIETAVSQTTLLCHSTILLEMTKKLSQKATTLAEGLGSESHPIKYRQKHTKQAKLFLRNIHEMLSWQWFRTSCKLHGNSIQKKYRQIEEFAKNMGRHLSQLDDLNSQQIKAVQNSDYAIVFSKIHKELLDLADQLDRINDECDAIAHRAMTHPDLTVDTLHRTGI